MYGRTLERLTGGVLLLVVAALAAQADELMSPAMTPEQVKALLGTPKAPLIVDVRTPVEFAIAHLPGAINIPVKELEKRVDELHQDHGNGVLVYCLNGSRTMQAEPILYTHGIDNIYHLEGSLEGWLQKNYPIEKGGVNRKSW